MLRVSVKEGNCQAHGVCSQIAPTYFDLDGDGYVVVVRADVEDAERDAVEEAVLACPAGALLLSEER